MPEYGIRRDADKNLVIPREDVPFLAGMVAGFDTHLEEVIAEGKIPGSFLPAMRQIQGFGKRVDKVLDNED